MSNHTETSVAWYLNWLSEQRPDLSPEQRLELATGFVQQQELPTRPAEDEDAADAAPDEDAPDEDAPDEEQLREQARANERKKLYTSLA